MTSPITPGGGAVRSAQLAALCRLIETHVGTADALPIAGLRLFSTDAVTEPTSSIAEASLAFVAQGAKQIAIGEHVLDYGPGDYLIVSVDLPITGRFTVASERQPFLGLALTLDPEVITDLALHPALGLAEARRVGRTLPALGTSSATPELLDALVRLLRLLDRPRDRDVLAPLLLRETFWWLLRGDQGELVQLAGLQHSSLAHIGRAVRWIRSHYAEPFRVEDLAAQVAMSPSSFHRHFRIATTMGPVQFQKKIRMQQARLLLIGSSMDVTRVAMQVGYESASQFSREYRREYGVSPSHDTTRGVARAEPA